MDHFTSLGRYVYLSSTLLALRFIQNWPTLNVYYGTPDHIEKNQTQTIFIWLHKEEGEKKANNTKKALKGATRAKMKNQATLYLHNFPKFSDQKGMLKIGVSKVCICGGGLKVGLLNNCHL